MYQRNRIMTQFTAKSFNIQPLILGFVLTIATLLYSSNAMAYFIGCHSCGGAIFQSYPANYSVIKVYRTTWVPSPRYVWTRWNYTSCGCRSSCLIDRHSGKTIRCNKRCAY